MSDKDNKGPDDGRIVHFPNAIERKKKQAEKTSAAQEEERLRRAYRARQQAHNAAHQPKFFNFGHVQIFTRLLLISYLVGFLPLELLFPELKPQIYSMFGFVPENVMGLIGGDMAGVSWMAPLGALTHVFLHGGAMHLMFNLVMTLVFGIMVEGILGTRRMIIFFFLCAGAGALFHLILTPFSPVPVIGASSGISGLFAFAMLTMQADGRMGIMRGKSPWMLVGIWALIMTGMGLLTPGNVAWQAHLGGFLAGAVIYEGIRTRKIRL